MGEEVELLVLVVELPVCARLTAAVLHPGRNRMTRSPPPELLLPVIEYHDLPWCVVPPKSWRVSYAASGLVLDSLIS